MKQKSGMIGVVYAAILSAIAGYFFRMTQLSGGSSVPLLAFSILMVFVFALAAVSLEKQSAYEAVYRPSGQVEAMFGALENKVADVKAKFSTKKQDNTSFSFGTHAE